MGISDQKGVKSENKKGEWMATFEQILKYVELNDRVVDVVKIDIESAEYGVLNELDIGYWCEYVKQFYVETHPSEPRNGIAKNWLPLLRKLEKCFLLFHRDTRFFAIGDYYYGGNIQSEFQPPRPYKVDLNMFIDETDLIDYMVVFGELYFLNKNFL